MRAEMEYSNLFERSFEIQHSLIDIHYSTFANQYS